MLRILLTSIILLTITGCDIVNQVIQETSNINLAEGFSGSLINEFNKSGPISTTFDDAKFEVDALYNFEPPETAYQPLDIQPKTSNGSYSLKSGLYTMNAKSFCLRGYTHGPSRGDGHLYAPLEGSKAELVSLILQRYGENPSIPQQNIQVLLWAIIAGSDMNTLGNQYANTLNELFTAGELLEFQGKDLLDGMANEQIAKFRSLALNSMSPKLRNMLEADNTMRRLISQNQSFQDIERVAIIAGVAPKSDMIREVSRGRWSYHPDGYFIRFFPNGYPQTKVDIYVPRKGEVVKDQRENFMLVNNDTGEEIEITYDPSSMVAVPANQSSQRIGVSPVPVNPTPPPADKYAITFLAYPTGKTYINKEGEESWSLSGHVFVAFSKNGNIENVKGFSPIVFNTMDGVVDENTDESYLLSFHDIKYCTNVSQQLYEAARQIRKDDYLLVFDDCVSYADDVADLIGLETPIFITDPIDFSFPMSFVRYITRNNSERPNTSCPIISSKIN